MKITTKHKIQIIFYSSTANMLEAEDFVDEITDLQHYNQIAQKSQGWIEFKTNEGSNARAIFVRIAGEYQYVFDFFFDNDDDAVMFKLKYF